MSMPAGEGTSEALLIGREAVREGARRTERERDGRGGGTRSGRVAEAAKVGVTSSVEGWQRVKGELTL